MTKGFPHGGVLTPPRFRSLVMNRETPNFKIIGVANDIVITVSGRFDEIVSNGMLVELNV